MHSQDQLNDEIFDSCEISNYSEQSHNYVSDIYYSATFIRQEINKMKPYLPWPPSPEDINEKNVQVPNALYNLLAWIFSGDNSKEPISEKRMQVSETVHKLVLSIAQDIVYVTSHGNIKSPKHVALPMTVKSKTGSSEIVTLLNQFGHGISYSVLREAETAMAERQTQRQEAGSLLPSNAQRNVFATFGFDNNDLLEETLSGKGTPHATNGILVQRRSLGCSNLEPVMKSRVKKILKRDLLSQSVFRL